MFEQTWKETKPVLVDIIYQDMENNRRKLRCPVLFEWELDENKVPTFVVWDYTARRFVPFLEHTLLRTGNYEVYVVRQGESPR